MIIRNLSIPLSKLLCGAIGSVVKIVLGKKYGEVKKEKEK
jgi:hypothetical protein